MKNIKIIYVTIFTVLISSIYCYAQKPRKIFSHIQENNLNLALEEYAKIKSDKVYDTDEKILFEIADCIFLINKSYPKYNPILSIKYFNNIYNNLDNYFNTPKSKKEIHEFLAKYELTFDTIANRIHSEIAFEAKKINTVESYDKALEVCSDKYTFELKQLKEEAFYKQTINESTIGAYKTFILTYSNSKHVSEIKSLLERKVLDNAKSKQSIDDLNSFIVEYATSNLKQEATDYRDSIVLSKVPNTYDAMLAFTKDYPNSKFTNNIQSNLGDLLYQRIEKNNEIIDCQLFMKEYANHVMYNEIKNKLHTMDSLIYKDAIDSNTYFTLKNYLDKFPNGIYSKRITSKINWQYRIFENVFLTNGMKIARLNSKHVDSMDSYDYIEDNGESELSYLKDDELKFDWDKDNLEDRFFRLNDKDDFWTWNYLVYLTKTKKILTIEISKHAHIDEKGIISFTMYYGTSHCSDDTEFKFNFELMNFELINFQVLCDDIEVENIDFTNKIMSIKINNTKKINKKFEDIEAFKNLPIPILFGEGYSLSEDYLKFDEIKNHSPLSHELYDSFR